MSAYTQWIKEHFDEQMDLLKTLAAIPSPSRHEEKRARFIQKWLYDNGMENAYIDEAKNVILTDWTAEDEPFAVYMAHTDVVFPDTEALPVNEADGYLYAPGVGDDTANAAALLMVVKYLKTTKTDPAAPMLFVWNSCEEGLGNLVGVRKVMETFGPRVSSLVSFDGGWPEIVNQAVGSERWKVTVKTEGGHSYARFGAPNAIAHLSKLICDLYTQTVPKAGTTYNAGMISGGTSVNTIAQQAEMLYEYRSDDYDCLEAMRASFEEKLAKAACPGVEIARELVGERPCGRVSDAAAQRALEEACRKAVETVTGLRPVMRPASTDANIPLSMGVPAVTFGLYIGEGAHTRGERVKISSLATGMEIALDLIAGIR